MLDKFLKYILYLISHISFHQIDEKEEVVPFECLILLIIHLFLERSSKESLKSGITGMRGKTLS